MTDVWGKSKTCVCVFVCVCHFLYPSTLEWGWEGTVEHCQAYHHQIRVDRVTYPSAGVIQTMEHQGAKALANKVTYVT